jgi:hypothetical protein
VNRVHHRWILAAAVPLLVSAGHAQSLPDSLRLGPDAAGFRVIHTWDRGRTRKPAADFSGGPARGEIGVPVRFAVWYPATRSRSARPITMLDLRLVGVHDAEHGRIDVANPFVVPSRSDSVAAIDDAVRIASRARTPPGPRCSARRSWRRRSRRIATPHLAEDRSRSR